MYLQLTCIRRNGEILYCRVSFFNPQTREFTDSGWGERMYRVGNIDSDFE